MERTYIVPLRKEWLKAPKYRRAKKATTALREFIAKHMKAEVVRILPDLNVAVWSRGMKNPPHKIKINVIKDDKGIVVAQLFGKPFEQPKVEEKPTKKAVKKAAKPEEKKEEEKAEQVIKEKPAAEEKTPSKEQAKEEKVDKPKETKPKKKTVKKSE